MEKERKKTCTNPLHLFILVLLLHSSSVSDFSRDSSSFMLALLQQLSGWFHSDATQTPLIIFFVISSCFLSKSETPSLTSTPTHLQNGNQLQLCSNFSLAQAQSQLHLFHGSSARLVPTEPALPWYGYDSTLALTPFWLQASCPPALALTNFCS